MTTAAAAPSLASDQWAAPVECYSTNAVPVKMQQPIRALPLWVFRSSGRKSALSVRANIRYLSRRIFLALMTTASAQILESARY